MTELLAISDSFVPGNSRFSHAGWTLLCIANGTCRVSARLYKRQDAEGRRAWYQRNRVNAHSLYKICLDVIGFFGEEGTFEPLEKLCKEQWELLELNRDEFVSDDEEERGGRLNITA